jgi:ATP-dependent protease ClpP protease subunit
MATRMAWAIKATNENEAEILLYDIIGGYDNEWKKNSAKNFIDKVKALGSNVQQISLRINSAGGDVFEAQAMYSYLRTHKAQKIVRIDGLAASAASLVAMAGDTIIMPANAMLMIHNPASFVWGEASEMREVAEVLDKIRDTIAIVYVSKTGIDCDKIKAMMDAETWMTADEALGLGFCDETDAAIEVAACARSLTEGDISWTTTAGEAIFSRALGAKMPAEAKKVPLILANSPDGKPQNGKKPYNMAINVKAEEKTTEEKTMDIKDIADIADLESAYPQFVNEVRDAASSAAYERGVQAERERLKALDSLTGPGREAIIAKAKYEDPKDARDIAMELLQASNNAAALTERQSDASVMNFVLTPSMIQTVQEALDTATTNVVAKINEMRGYLK